jgi:uncharacterized membrane protein
MIPGRGPRPRRPRDSRPEAVLLETLLARTSLPDAHAGLAHAPAALAAAALLLDAWWIAVRGPRGFERAAAALWLVAALAAGGAWLSGGHAGPAESPAARAALAVHVEAARLAVAALGLAAALRLLAARWPRAVGALSRIAGAAALGVVLLASDRGAALVHRHGVGVRAAEPEAATRELAPPPAVGIALPVRGHAELALGGIAEDAGVEAMLDLTGFRGAAALVRRSTGGEEALELRVGGDGAVELAVRRGAAREVLARAARSPGADRLALGLARDGSRWRGSVDGVPAVEAELALAARTVAVVLEGEGEARVEALRVAPPPVAARGETPQ